MTAYRGIRKTRWKENESLEDRFLKRVKKTDSCWLWNGCFAKFGYGIMRYKRKRILAHRWSYIIYKDKRIKNKVICHKCDNPKCVNPGHLFMGTHNDNVQDMMKKGRQRFGITRKNTKLTDEQVFYAYKNRQIGSVQMGKYLGVSHSCISMIRSGKRRRHLMSGEK